MPKSRRKRLLIIAAWLGLLIGGPRVIEGRVFTFQSPNHQEQAEKKRAFQEFGQRVDQYQKLRNKLEHGLPSLKPADDPRAILTREQSLAQRIVAARKDAKRGDIFTDEISVEFRKLIRNAFNGPVGSELHKTINQGTPVDLTLHVNQIYPASTPFTTVPPTILQRLPKLPPGLEYHFVAHDMILEDMRARLVVDLMTDAYPRRTP